MRTLDQLRNIIADKLKDEYKGLIRTSNTNKSYNNILTLVDDIADIAFAEGKLKGIRESQGN